MTLRFFTNTEMKANWPKDSQGLNLDLNTVIDNIIGSELNAELSQHYDGWGHGSNGESSWFFTDVSDDLQNKIRYAFQNKNVAFLNVK
jgi:hypothetical protein